MKKMLICTIVFFTLVKSSFALLSNHDIPVEEPIKILKDFNSFLNYMGENLKLSEDFTAYNTYSKIISKGTFLKMLTSGDYLPLRLRSTDNKLYFKLYRYNVLIGKDIRGSTQGWAQVFYEHYERQGKKFPAFNFVDLNGHIYNKETTKGKVIVLKCWFIGCPICEKEIPALNKLVKKYKNRMDIIFVSLAPDSKKKLQIFLKKKRFDYAEVPNQNTFMSKELNVNAFPTHFIINKQGIIVSVVDTPEEIDYALKNKI
ncbi:MAG TPA: TlpA disulfide reductase family protein [Mucilaginibacter sp.]